jgi:PAP2 superfamily protein
VGSAATLKRWIASLRHSWHGRHELALFAAAYLTYFGVRALTEGAQGKAVLHAKDLFHFEGVLGIDWERAIQALALDSSGVRSIANSIYIWGHWPVLIVGGVLLFHLARGEYYLLRNVCLLSGAVGLVIFAFFPVAPPRLSGLGFVDTVTLHASGYRHVLSPSLVNEYAAMPSFHAGWDLMLGIALFQASRNLLIRLFAVCMPAAMGFATIATANHFVLDVFVGAAIVTAAVILVERRGRRARLDSHGVPLALAAGGGTPRGK